MACVFRIEGYDFFIYNLLFESVNYLWQTII